MAKHKLQHKLQQEWPVPDTKAYYYVVKAYHNGEEQPQLEWSNVAFAGNTKPLLQHAIGYAVMHTIEEYHCSSVDVCISVDRDNIIVTPANNYKPLINPLINGKPTNVIVAVELVANHTQEVTD